MGRIVSIQSQKNNGVNANIILKPGQHDDLIAKLHKKLGRPVTASEIRTILYEFVQNVDITRTEPFPLPNPNLNEVTETVNAPTTRSKPTKLQTEINNDVHTVEPHSYKLDNELQQQVDSVLYDTLGLEQEEEYDEFYISDDDF